MARESVRRRLVDLEQLDGDTVPTLVRDVRIGDTLTREPSARRRMKTDRQTVVKIEIPAMCHGHVHLVFDHGWKWCIHRGEIVYVLL